MTEENGRYYPLHDDQQNISDQQTPAQPASVWGTLGMLANMVRSVTGRSRWSDSPPTNLTEAKAHHDNRSNPHNVTRAQLGAAAQTALDSHKADQQNPHNTTAAQAGAPPTSRTISTSAPLSGGGSLAANRTLSITEATTSAPGSMSAADKSKLNGLNAADYAPASHVGSRDGHPIATSTQHGFLRSSDKAKVDVIGQLLELVRAADQPHAGGYMTLSFDTENADEMGWYDPANPTIIKPTVSCVADVYLKATFTTNNSGIRAIRLYSSTRQTLLESAVVSGSVDNLGRCGEAGLLRLQANEELTVQVYQNAGSIAVGNSSNRGAPQPMVRMARLT